MGNVTTTEPTWLRLSPSFEERLTAKLSERPDGCIVWTGSTNGKGYGRIGAGGRGAGLVYTHRAAWQLANNRPIPAGMVVCHSCDNPPCCNPEHLFVAPQSENARDMVRKGRGPWCMGRMTTDVEVEAIRRMVSDGRSIADAARAFGINYWTVRDIARGRRRSNTPSID